MPPLRTEKRRDRKPLNVVAGVHVQRIPLKGNPSDVVAAGHSTPIEGKIERLCGEVILSAGTLTHLDDPSCP